MMKTIKTIFGVLGVQPLGEWGALKSKIEGRGKAFPLIATLLLTLTLHAEVICIWDGNGYTCSGSGTQVNVIGGGELAPVVTNGVGVCTNCAAISPDQLCALADQIETQAGYIKQATDTIMDKASIVQDSIEVHRNDIDTFRLFTVPIFSPDEIYAVTNYAFTSTNLQAQAMRRTFSNRDDFWDDGLSEFQVVVGAANGVYYYANNTVLPQLNSYYQDVSDISGQAAIANSAAWTITDELLPELREGCNACQAGIGSGGGGGSSGGTNSNGTVTGDWCTFDQGEAIKRLLSELSNYVARCEGRLLGISNNTAIIIQSIKDAIYSPYNAIPEAAGLGGQTWQDVYLQGADTPWGYESTNYLARIELLLYGLSGVGTNSTFMGEDEDFSQADQDLNALKNSLGGIRSDADGTQAETLGQAVVNFFNAFTPTTKALDDGDELLPEIPYSLGGEEYMVPGINATGRNVQLYNTLQPFVRGTCTAVYFFIGALSVFFYWRWFAEKCVAFSKWAIELVGTLFYQ